MKFFKNKEVLVIGGLGYVGTSLVPSLIKDGYTVTILDSMIFGNNLELQESKNLKIIKTAMIILVLPLQILVMVLRGLEFIILKTTN